MFLMMTVNVNFMLMISRFTQFWAMLVIRPMLIYKVSWMNCRTGLTGGNWIYLIRNVMHYFLATRKKHRV